MLNCQYNMYINICYKIVREEGLFFYIYFMRLFLPIY